MPAGAGACILPGNSSLCLCSFGCAQAEWPEGVSEAQSLCPEQVLQGGFSLLTHVWKGVSTADLELVELQVTPGPELSHESPELWTRKPGGPAVDKCSLSTVKLNSIHCIIFIYVCGGLHVPLTGARRGHWVSPWTPFCLVLLKPGLLLNPESICQLGSQTARPRFSPVYPTPCCSYRCVQDHSQVLSGC